MNLLQFVPKLPGNDGIGDYALELAHSCLRNDDLKTHFVIYDGPCSKNNLIQSFESSALDDLSDQSTLTEVASNAQNIIFHFNYIGSSKKVLALLEAIHRIKRLTSSRLIIMFHELKVVTKVSGDFEIFNPRHFWATFQIARAADFLFTNNADSRALLSRWTGKDVVSIPIFSTVGEPQTVPLVSQRQSRMIVFGSRTSRLRVYQKFSQNLLESCRCLGLTEIWDVGNPIDQQVDLPENMIFHSTGFQPRKVVSELLLDSLAGFLDYSEFPKRLAKSSIYAAYCVHGIIPVCSTKHLSEADGIYVNKHYLVGGKQMKQVNTSELQVVSNYVVQWYSSHTCTQTCRIFSKLITAKSL